MHCHTTSHEENKMRKVRTAYMTEVAYKTDKAFSMTPTEAIHTL